MTERADASPRLLVTGARGFVGRHVHEAMAAGKFGSWEFVSVPDDFEIRDEAQVDRLVAELKPSAVLHLAAQSFVPRSFEQPRETLEINVVGTLNLLRALSRVKFAGRLLYVSSGDVFGRVPDDALPVNERRWPEPRNPYAVSKVAAEQLCLQWHRAHGMDVIVARPFNHIGPGQGGDFAIPSFARQVVEIQAGSRPAVLEAGDIDTTRDFTDVRDVVGAYRAMLERGTAGRTYLVGSGIERRIRDLIGMMCDMCGVAPEIRQDVSRLRPAEQRRMVADASLLHADTGWAPTFTIQQTLEDVLNDARGRYEQQR